MSLLETFSLEYRFTKQRFKNKTPIEKKISNNKNLELIKSKTYNFISQKNNLQKQLDIQYLERQKTFSLQAKAINKLIQLGFKMDTILCLIKQRPFNSIEEALYYLEKDPDSNLYNHYFRAMEYPNNNLCKICQNEIKDHIKENSDLSTLKNLKIENRKFLTYTNGYNFANFKENIINHNVVKKNFEFSINNSRTPTELNLDSGNGNNSDYNTQETNNTMRKINKEENIEVSQFPLLCKNKSKFNLNNNCEVLVINEKENYRQFQYNDLKKSSINKSTINHNISINIKEPGCKKMPKISNTIISPLSIKIYKNKNLESINNEEKENNSYYKENHQDDIIYNDNSLDVNGNNNKITNINKNNKNQNTINNHDENANKNVIINNNKNIKIKLQKYCKIEIPIETLDSFQDPDICPICYENKVNKNNIAQINCKHKFCDKCIKTYLTKKIIDGDVLKIHCLMCGCKHIYTKEQIKSNVPINIFNKYIKFYQKQTKLKNPNNLYINCAQTDCEELIDCTNIKEGNITCKLGHTFCRKCFKIGGHLPNDSPCTINDLNQEFFKKLNKKNEYNVRIKYKQCPQCKVLIEKIDGCNQMKCINCEYNFCWLCLKKYTYDHYYLYNINGCPGMRYETEKMYRIRNSFCNKCLWHLLSCLLRVLMFICIYIFYFFCGCIYEFVKCYRNRGKKNSPKDNIIDINDNYLSFRKKINLSSMDDEKDNKYIIGLLIILGILCQPIYLSFYLLYVLIEFFRRLNCMFYLPG